MEAAVRLPDDDPEGWLRLRLRLDWPEEVPVQLLSAGPDVEVLEPPEVRQLMIEVSRAVAARYEPPGRATPD